MVPVRLKYLITNWLLHLDRWCERTGRKLIIRNTYNGAPTLLRYSLFPTKSSPTAPSREPRWGNIYLHKFLQTEEFDLHDHPWPFISFILRGRYQERLPNNKKRLRKTGTLHFFPAESVHSVELEDNETCWTLVLRGPHVRQWGYHTRSGWVPARNYLANVQGVARIESVQRPTSSGPVIPDSWKEFPKHVLLLGDDGLLCPHMADHLMDYHPTTALTIVSRGMDAERIRDSSRFTRQFASGHLQILPYSSFTSEGFKETVASIDTIIYLDAHAPQLHTKTEDQIQRGSAGVLRALETAADLKIKRFTLVSSGDVQGPVQRRRAHHPTERTFPWSIDRAALVGAEALVQAWSQEHEGIFTTVRTPEVFGERTPLDRTVGRLLQALTTNSTIQLRSRKNTHGKTCLSRHQYLHARDTARAILHATMNGTSGQLYHLAGKELDDAELVDCLASLTGLHPQVEYKPAARSTDGHRFALEDTLGKELRWKAPHGFELSLRNTVEWMFRAQNQRWLQVNE